MSRKRKALIGVVSLPLLILAVCCGYAYYSASKWCSSFGIGDAPLICVRQSVIGEPRVRHPVQLRVEVARRGSEGSSTDVKVVLPPEVELMDGSLEWQVDLATTKRAVQTLTIRVKQAGEWEIETSAYSHLGSWTRNGIYLLSSPAAGEVSDRESPNNWIGGMGVAIPARDKGDERFWGGLQLSGPPSLGGEIAVTYTFTTLLPLGQVEMVIGFPPKGFEVISVESPAGTISTGGGSISWVGDLGGHQSRSLAVTFRIMDVGRGEVYGYSRVSLGGVEGSTSLVTAATTAHLEVNRYGGSFQILESP